MAAKTTSRVPAKMGTNKKGNGLSEKQVIAAIDEGVNAIKNGQMAVSNAAYQTLLFVRQHGDATLFQRLYEGLGTCGVRNGPKFQSALMQWLQKYSPVRRNSGSKPFTRANGKEIAPGGFCLLDKSFNDDSKWNLDGAQAEPFMELAMAERKPASMSRETVEKRAKKLLEDIAKAEEEDRWAGPKVTKETLTSLRKLGNVVDKDNIPF